MKTDTDQVNAAPSPTSPRKDVRHWLLVASLLLACRSPDGGDELIGGTGETGETTDGGESSFIVRSIEGGAGSMCAIATDGTPLCWGYVLRDLIGDDEPASEGRVVPDEVKLEQLRLFVEIACGLREGRLLCWGRDFGVGLLAYGLDDDVTLSFAQAVELGGIDIGEAVVAFDIGGPTHILEAHACALTETGAVYCWGSGWGLGHPGVFVGDYETPAELGPVVIGGQAVAIDAGGMGACAIMTDGNARCWGYTLLTGYEPLKSDEVPADRPWLDLGGPIKQISIGDYHACAIVGDGEVKCWGANTGGVLGRPGVGTVEPSSMLQPVDLGGVALEIVVRSEHSCARLEGGSVVCWGSGHYGKTGHPWEADCEQVAPEAGFLSHDCAAGPLCCIGDDETPEDVGAVELPGPALALAASELGTCALIDTGELICWGGGFEGHLGDGLTPACAHEPGLVPWCGFDPRCCVGDDEPPSGARPVIFD